jgi:hypothetical protein
LDEGQYPSLRHVYILPYERGSLSTSDYDGIARHMHIWKTGVNELLNNNAANASRRLRPSSEFRCHWCDIIGTWYYLKFIRNSRQLYIGFFRRERCVFFPERFLSQVSWRQQRLQPGRIRGDAQQIIRFRGACLEK